MVDKKISSLDPLTTVTNNLTAFAVYDPDGATSEDENKRYEFSALLTDVTNALTLTNGLTLITAADTTADYLANKVQAGVSGLISVTVDATIPTDEKLVIDFVGTAAGEPYFSANSSNTLPLATGTNSFAIGDGANVTSNGSYQIGPGTNSQDGTLQYTTVPIAQAGEGLIAQYVTSDPVTIIENGSIKVSNYPSFWYQSQGQWIQIKKIQSFNEDIGNTINDTFTVTHNFGTRRYSVDVVRTSGDFDDVYPDFQRGPNDCTIDFNGYIPNNGEFRVLLQTKPL